MSFYSEMERVIKNQGDAGLDHLEYYYGIELELRRPTKSNAYGRVHGSQAGTNTAHIKDFKGVVEGNDFFESNRGISPSFLAGFLYTRETDILVGDVIHIKADDDRHTKYKITAKETIGLTTKVFQKWKLSALGD